jgi:hypothetical protein
MSEEQSGPISSADIQAVGDRLEEFSESLPASQRAVIAWLLQRVGMRTDDESNVQGYGIVLKRRSDAPTDAGGPAAVTFEFECTWALESDEG